MHTAPPVRLAVFDLDGTLVDSRRDLALAANSMIAELGGSPLSEQAVGDMVGEGAGVLVRRALTASGLDPDHPGALALFLAHYDEHLDDWTRPYEGIPDVLATLGRRMPLAVLTNKPQRATDRLLDALELRKPFGLVIGGDSAFGRKPGPAGLLHIVAAHGVRAAETVLVGDSPIDVATARAAGTRICVARYGFGYRDELLAPGDLVARDPGELAGLL